MEYILLAFNKFKLCFKTLKAFFFKQRVDKYLELKCHPSSWKYIIKIFSMHVLVINHYKKYFKSRQCQTAKKIFYNRSLKTIKKSMLNNVLYSYCYFRIIGPHRRRTKNYLYTFTVLSYTKFN